MLPTLELEAEAAARWIRARLVAVAALTAALGGAAAPRIFDRPAPPGTAYPLLVFEHVTPEDDARVLNTGGSRVLASGLWSVRAIAEGESYAPLTTVAQLAGVALNGAAGDAPAVEGYTAWVEATRVQPIRFATVEAGKQYRHLGGLYRLTVHTP